jgi:hypothetical protein
MTEPTFTLTLTRSEVVALLVDSNREKFPTPDSSDSTVRILDDLKNWYLANSTKKATSFWAQVRDNHEGSGWRTVGTSEQSAHDAAWGSLADEMQRRGLRYSELTDHIADMERGEELSAEDGTQFRILAPGQEVTK